MFCCFEENNYDLENKSNYKQKAFVYIQASLLTQVYERNPLFNMYFKTEGRKASLPMDLKYALVSVEEGSNLK